jgi:hypothetical protein
LRQGDQAQAALFRVAAGESSDDLDIPDDSAAPAPSDRPGPPAASLAIGASGEHRAAHDQRHRDSREHAERVDRHLDERAIKLRLSMAAVQLGRWLLHERHRCDPVDISAGHCGRRWDGSRPGISGQRVGLGVGVIGGQRVGRDAQ